MEKDIKLLIKLINPEKTASCWSHLCYVDRDTYNNYTAINDSEYINESLSQWCKEDFNVELDMATLEDIEQLKSLVKDLYKQKYPEIYREGTTDHQGWLRLWVVNHMKEEIYGRIDDGK